MNAFSEDAKYDISNMPGADIQANYEASRTDAWSTIEELQITQRIVSVCEYLYHESRGIELEMTLQKPEWCNRIVWQEEEVVLAERLHRLLSILGLHLERTPHRLAPPQMPLHSPRKLRRHRPDLPQHLPLPIQLGLLE